METIKDLKKILENNIYRHSRILTLRKYHRQNNLIINALTTTSKNKVLEALTTLDNIVNDHGFAINSIKQKKNEKIIRDQQIKDERKRIEREQTQVPQRHDNQLDDFVTATVKSKSGHENVIVTSRVNNGIIGSLSERNMALGVTDLLEIDYQRYKGYLKRIHDNIPEGKKVMLNILNSSGWSTYKKKYLTKEELWSYCDDYGPEPGMPDSLLCIYGFSISYR